MKNRFIRNLTALGILAASVLGASVIANCEEAVPESIAFKTEAYILPTLDAEFDMASILEITGGDAGEIIYSVYDDTVAEVNEEGMLLAKDYGVTTIIACVAADETICASIDVAVCDFYGMYAGTKMIEAMGCDIDVEITLEEDGTYSFYRAPMNINMDGGGEMPEMTDNGTYEVNGIEVTFTGEELGEFTVTFQLDEDGTSLVGKIPTGGPATQMELVKAETEEALEAEIEEANTASLANDYYIDLTELGMKLTFYLRLEEEGTFLFSNTLDFEVNKSSGTFQESEGAYLMVYDSVNGEEKSVSDGVTSTFEVLEDGTLDFTESMIYYGSATANTGSAEEENAKLLAKVVTEDYESPTIESEFQTGIYVSENVTEGDVTYSHTVSFYEDNSYVHTTIYDKDGKTAFACETGTYGVSTSQLALSPEKTEADGMESRIECEVVDDSHLKLSILPYIDAEERTQLDFTKTDSAEKIAELNGEAVGKEGDSYDATVKIYADGTYESLVEGFTETGILVLDTEENYLKQYPDHPETGVRGLNQVATVPAGTLTFDGNALLLKGLRIRKSAGLTRYECAVSEGNR